MIAKLVKVCLAIGLGSQVVMVLAACDYGIRDFSQAPESGKLAAVRRRAFATTDREKVLRATIDTLQNLGFQVDRADYNLSSVSGAKLDQYLLRWTVTIVPHDNSRLLVRAAGRYDVTPVLEPAPYEKFFTALSHALVLEAQSVD